MDPWRFVFVKKEFVDIIPNCHEQRQEPNDLKHETWSQNTSYILNNNQINKIPQPPTMERRRKPIQSTKRGWNRENLWFPQETGPHELNTIMFIIITIKYPPIGGTMMWNFSMNRYCVIPRNRSRQKLTTSRMDFWNTNLLISILTR